MKKFVIASLLALTAVSSQAAVTVGDVLVGFTATGGVGADQNVVVDLSQYLSTSSTYVNNSSIVNLSSVLSSTFGNDWATRSDLKFGAAAATGNSLSTPRVILSSAELTAGVQSLQRAPLSKGTLGSGALKIETQPTTYSALTAVSSNSFSAVYVAPTSIVNSWNANKDFTAGLSFAYFSPYIDTTANLTQGGIASQLDGTSYAVLDLYKYVGTATTATNVASLIGGLGLNASGNLAFNTDIAQFAAIPEPSTYAMILGALTLGVVGLRRRFSKAV